MSLTETCSQGKSILSTGCYLLGSGALSLLPPLKPQCLCRFGPGYLITLHTGPHLNGPCIQLVSFLSAWVPLLTPQAGRPRFLSRNFCHQNSWCPTLWLPPPLLGPFLQDSLGLMETSSYQSHYVFPFWHSPSCSPHLPCSRDSRAAILISLVQTLAATPLPLPLQRAWLENPKPNYPTTQLYFSTAAALNAWPQSSEVYSAQPGRPLCSLSKFSFPCSETHISQHPQPRLT